jgi:hypothetical protein
MKTTLAHPVSLTSRRLTRVCLAGVLVSLIGFTLTDNVAHATSYAVTTTTDGGPGSLRDAISQANVNPGPDTVTVPAGTYTLTIAGANEDSNATGDLDINGALTIVGAGAGSTIIDADGIDRVFDVQGGPTVLQGLTITNGDVGSGGGGNIVQRQFADLTVQDSVVSNGAALAGAGIGGDKGALAIYRSEIINNVATSIQGNGSVGSAVSKGGLGQGSLIIEDSVIAGNDAIGGTAALYIGTNATITNSTITGNSSYARTVLVEGQGAFSMAANFVHVTIAGNSTTGNVPGDALAINVVAPATMSATVEGSLFQDNMVQGSSSNCAVVALGAIVSNGNNLTDDTSCATFLQPTDQANNQATTLAALANNGGPTRTMALVAGSSAIDGAGNCGAATATDQRGVSRPQGPACDAGAFEADAAVVVTTTTITPTTVAPTTIAPTLPPTTLTPTTLTPTTLVEPPTSLDSGVVGATSSPPVVTEAPPVHRQLPVTGDDSASGIWLATLVCSLGALLVLTARRMAR